MIIAVKGTVYWNDPQGSATDVLNNDNINSKHKPILMETLGWIIRDDDEGISICNERYLQDGEWQYRGHTFVVRALIVKVKKGRAGGRGKTVQHGSDKGHRRGKDRPGGVPEPTGDPGVL